LNFAIKVWWSKNSCVPQHCARQTSTLLVLYPSSCIFWQEYQITSFCNQGDTVISAHDPHKIQVEWLTTVYNTSRDCTSCCTLLLSQ